LQSPRTDFRVQQDMASLTPLPFRTCAVWYSFLSIVQTIVGCGSLLSGWQGGPGAPDYRGYRGGVDFAVLGRRCDRGWSEAAREGSLRNKLKGAFSKPLCEQHCR
jgi:hypothetical protein